MSIKCVPLLSVITPIYNNELNIKICIKKLLDLKESIKSDFNLEVIFVDDCSEDNSLNLLLEFKKKYSWLKVLKFTKNFNFPNGIFAGFEYAKGDCVAYLAADMQDPPELLKDMLVFWKEGSKVVLAERKDRDESWFQKTIANFFHSLMRGYVLKNYPKQGADLFLIDKKIVKIINNIQERNTHITALIVWLGFQYKSISYVRQERKLGKSGFTFSKKVKYFIDSFISFSYFPIRLISIFGIVVSCISFLFGIYTAYEKIIYGISIQGYATITILVTLLLGIIIFMLGIIGEYLWRILDEVKGRPRYIIEEEWIDE